MASVDATALDNAITTDDVVQALDAEMVENFNGELSKLTELIGIFEPEVVAAGTAMYQYEVTGSLDTTDVEEGAEVPLSEYTVSRTALDPIEVKPYRKQTTAQAILKAGFEKAVTRTDSKMISQVRSSILSDFFAFLANGTGTASGDGLQGALAYADAAIVTALEENGDGTSSVVHFVNPTDIAGYLAGAQVTLQTVFGMQYIQSFLGVTDIFVTANVPSGTVYATPVENIHLYGVDFSTLGTAGLTYATQDGGLIGVHHAANYSRTSAETFVLSGALMVAEITNYIVVASIEDPTA